MAAELTALCFESAKEASLFRELCGDVLPAFTLDDIASRVVPDPPTPPEERQREWERLLSSEELPERESFEATVKLLRDSLILSHEDIDYAFSHLPATPKNERLKALFRSYLDTPLARDTTARAWQAVEALKEGEIRWDLKGGLGFVRAASRSPVFDELAKAFGYFPGVEATLLEPWQIPVEGARKRRSALLRGTPANLLPRLAEKIAGLLKKGISAEKIEVAVHASPEAMSFFKFLLDSHRVPHRCLVPDSDTPVPEADDLSRLISAIRGDRTRPLKDRLQLSAQVLRMARGKRALESWPDFLSREVGSGKLEGTDAAYLAAIPQPSGPAPAPKGGVTLFPLVPFPLPPGRRRFAFLDETYFAADSAPLALRPAELDALAVAGFRLSQSFQARKQRERALVSLTRGPAAAGSLFTELSSQRLPERRSFAMKARVPAPRHREDRDEPRAKVEIKSLSATQLEQYARCPAAYFFSKCLRLERNDSSDRQYALWLGQTVHLALERVLKQPDGVTDWERELQNALTDVAPGVSEGHPLYTALRAHCRQLLQKMPRLEKGLRELFGELEPFELEKPFRLVVEGVPLTGKIDRIDKLPDGSLVVLDYKTGNVDFTPEDVRRGENFQALLYLLALEETSSAPSVGILFYDLKKGEIRKGILIEEKVSREAKKAVTRGHTLTEERYQELRRDGIQKLSSLARAINSGDFHPTPSIGICGMCEFASLCRQGAGYV